MTWCDLTLGDALRVEHGFAFKSEFFQPEGQLLVVTPGNFLEPGGFRVRPGKERYYSGDFPERYLLKTDDLIIAMTEQGEGLLGSAARIPDDNGFLHNQRIGLVKLTDTNRLNKRFAYWLFNSAAVRAQIRGSASGTKVRHTAPERIYKVRVRVPPVGDQAQISSVLDPYDDLIENNRRRIALLEESAQLLYREWFVDLRFPGCGPFVQTTGLPNGWRHAHLEEALFLQRGFDLPSASRVPEAVPVYASAGIVGYHNQAMAAGPGVVTGRSGTLGAVHFVDETYWPLNTALWVKEFRAASPAFAYFLLLEMNLAQYNSGSSVPTLDRKVVHAQPVVIPAAEAMAEFEARASVVFAQIKILRASTAFATEARNALLPKLMSGEIAV